MSEGAQYCSKCLDGHQRNRRFANRRIPQSERVRQIAELIQRYEERGGYESRVAELRVELAHETALSMMIRGHG